MASIQQVLFHPFAFLRVLSKENVEVPQKRRRKERQLRLSEGPHYSDRFRFEKECSNYRSIHFPR